MVDINVDQQFLNAELLAAAREVGFEPTDLLGKAYSYDDLSESFKALAGFSKLCNPIEYLDQHFAGREIFRFIATHPHMDHLHGLADLVFNRTIVNFWYTAKDITKPDFAGSPYREADWAAFQLFAAGRYGATPLSPKQLDSNYYWADDGIEVWLPTPQIELDAVNGNEPNLASYVLGIKHGATLIVLGGDADATSWAKLHEQFGGRLPKVTVLKASHHGRRSGYHQPSVAAMAPELTLVSVGKKPPTDASRLYAQFSNTVLSTRYQGNIIVECYEDGRGFYVTDRMRAEAATGSQR